MAQYSSKRNNLLNNNDALYEVVMTAGNAGPSIYLPEGNLNLSTDAFGRSRVSDLYTIFDSRNITIESDDFYETGTGLYNKTYIQNQSSVLLSVGGASSSHSYTSKRRIVYQPGKSRLTMQSFSFASQATGLTQRLGLFDDRDGIYLEQDETETYFVIKTYTSGTVTYTKIPRSEWNINKLNSNGINLDLTKVQIFWTDIEWLGVGSVRCGFVINGQFVLCHVFHHANKLDTVYMSNPNLPVNYEIVTDGTYTGWSTGMNIICSSVVSEGGYDTLGKTYTFNFTGWPGYQTIGTNWESLMGIRLYNSQQYHRVVAVINNVSINNISNQILEWGIFKNPNGSSVSWSWGSDRPEFQYMIGGHIIYQSWPITGGYMHSSESLQSIPIIDASGKINWNYQLGMQNSSTVDEYFLAVRSRTSNAAVVGSIQVSIL